MATRGRVLLLGIPLLACVLTLLLLMERQSYYHPSPAPEGGSASLASRLAGQGGGMQAQRVAATATQRGADGHIVDPDANKKAAAAAAAAKAALAAKAAAEEAAAAAKAKAEEEAQAAAARELGPVQPFDFTYRESQRQHEKPLPGALSTHGSLHLRSMHSSRAHQLQWLPNNTLTPLH